MDRIGDAFVWPFRDPDWLGKVVIIGLILLIPIVGGINGLGWMLATIDRLRKGEQRLTPANFDYLGRGVQRVGDCDAREAELRDLRGRRSRCCAAFRLS